jgi:hypothetical protein
MRDACLDKHYCETTGKLHIPCPCRELTDINTHVVIKNGYCYRSEECMVVKCKYNRIQSDFKSLLSILW